MRWFQMINHDSIGTHFLRQESKSNQIKNWKEKLWKRKGENKAFKMYHHPSMGIFLRMRSLVKGSMTVHLGDVWDPKRAFPGGETTIHEKSKHN